MGLTFNNDDLNIKLFEKIDTDIFEKLMYSNDMNKLKKELDVFIETFFNENREFPYGVDSLGYFVSNSENASIRFGGLIETSFRLAITALFEYTPSVFNKDIILENVKCLYSIMENKGILKKFSQDVGKPLSYMIKELSLFGDFYVEKKVIEIIKLLDHFDINKNTIKLEVDEIPLPFVLLSNGNFSLLEYLIKKEMDLDVINRNGVTFDKYASEVLNNFENVGLMDSSVMFIKSKLSHNLFSKGVPSSFVSRANFEL